MPVILVTAVASETGLDFDAATAEERGWIKADAVLDKPVRFEQLAARDRAAAASAVNVMEDAAGPGRRRRAGDALRRRRALLRAHAPRCRTWTARCASRSTQADTGEEAWSSSTAAPPDILLLDHKLPGIGGLEVLTRSREPRRSTC